MLEQNFKGLAVWLLTTTFFSRWSHGRWGIRPYGDGYGSEAPILRSSVISAAQHACMQLQCSPGYGQRYSHLLDQQVTMTSLQCVCRVYMLSGR
jgi:hypothetical protein